MPSLSTRTPDEPIKIMLIGHSGVGKTGALASLVAAGYRIRILDMDNGLDSLTEYVKHECPERLSSIDYMTFRDTFKPSPQGPRLTGQPCIIGATKALDKWEDGSEPATWTTDTILVLDSLTNFGMAAYNWAKQMNPTVKEKRQWYQEGQNFIETIISMLTSDTFGANVIVTSHVDLREQPDGSTKGFASALGAALGPKLPRFFNTLVLLETKGSGNNARRILRTVPTATIDLKNPAPFRVAAEYPIETGLADLFRELRSGAPTKE